jgi:hypothetical protein
MTSTAYPTVHAAVISVARTALATPITSGTFRVSDGFDLSDDPGDLMEIGVPSLSDTQSISAGSFSQDATTFGRAGGVRTETGTINGTVMARNGEGDQGAARVAAFGYLATLGDAIRADPSLGVTSLGELVAQLSTGDVAEDQVDGATTAISFTVAYRAFI